MSKTVLVTGGTRGIGRAVSLAMKDAGYTVTASYSSNVEAATAFESETGIRVVQFDVGDFDACQKAIQEVEENVGPIDVLVNNAGITRDKPLHKMNKDTWDSVLTTNLDSLFNMCRGVIDGMRERGFGRIINISSINGQKGQFGQTNYSAAKAGQIGFTKALAYETASKGITVNSIAPGYVGTEMVQAVPEEVMKTAILPHIPVGRVGEPEEIARCVVFLASDDAGFITGSTLTVNGGHYMA